MSITLLLPLDEEFSGALTLLRELGANLPDGLPNTPKDVPGSIRLTQKHKVDLRLIAMDPTNKQAMGNVVSCARTSTILTKIRPSILIMAGIAGSLDHTTVRLGDVVVTSAAKYLRPDKLTVADKNKVTIVDKMVTPTPGGPFVLAAQKKWGKESVVRLRRDRASHSNSDALVMSYAQNFELNPCPGLEPIDTSTMSPQSAEKFRNDQPTVKHGDILGSEWVVDSQEYVDFVRARNDDDQWDWYGQAEKRELEDLKAGKLSALSGENRTRNTWELKTPIVAVDMETYGFFKALEAQREMHYQPLHAFAVRGISDPSAGKGDLDKDSSGAIRRVAIRNAIRVAMDIGKELALKNANLS